MDKEIIKRILDKIRDIKTNGIAGFVYAPYIPSQPLHETIPMVKLSNIRKRRFAMILDATFVKQDSIKKMMDNLREFLKRKFLHELRDKKEN